MVRLETGRLMAGRALPFTLHDRQGRVLLKQGSVIEREDQLERLIERGAYYDEIPDETLPESSLAEQVCIREMLASIIGEYEPVLARPHHALVPDEILGIARQIQAACRLDPEPALACIQLQRASRYSLRHSFHTAILTEVLLTRAGRDEAHRLHAVAGALTMNVAMLSLQDDLYQQNAALTDEQKRMVVGHTLSGVRILKEVGVAHPVWLDVVEHHHEMLDGSGYPKRLRGESLSLEAQVVSLADRYSAMVSERAYRPGTLPHVAAKELLSRHAATIDPAIGAMFLKEIGLYPPGTVVTLANAELAVVVRRTLNPAQPIVRSVRAPSGVRYPEPPKRLTSKATYAIRDVLGPEQVRDFDLSKLWPRADLETETEEIARTA